MKSPLPPPPAFLESAHPQNDLFLFSNFHKLPKIIMISLLSKQWLLNFILRFLWQKFFLHFVKINLLFRFFFTKLPAQVNDFEAIKCFFSYINKPQILLLFYFFFPKKWQHDRIIVWLWNCKWSNHGYLCVHVCLEGGGRLFSRFWNQIIKKKIYDSKNSPVDNGKDSHDGKGRAVWNRLESFFHWRRMLIL